MAKTLNIASASLVAGALALVPMSSAFAGGPHWSHGPSHGPAFHGGYHANYWHGGGGYWHGGVWWPGAVAAAVVGTTAAIIAAPFVAFGNVAASAAYVSPAAPYYAPQQYYSPPVSYNAPPQYYAPPVSYNVPSSTTHHLSRASALHQAAPQYQAPPNRAEELSRNAQPQGTTGQQRRSPHANYAPPDHVLSSAPAPVAYNYYSR